MPFGRNGRGKSWVDVWCRYRISGLLDPNHFTFIFGPLRIHSVELWTGSASIRASVKTESDLLS